MPSSVARYHDPNAEAKLLLGFVAVALVAGTGYICYSRLHVRKEQLMEASLYILAWSFVFWDMLRYTLTATCREGRTPGRIRHCASAASRTTRALQKAFADNSIVIGYDIHQKPRALAGRSARHAGQRLRHDRRRQDHPAAEHHPARPCPGDRAKGQPSQDPAHHHRRQRANASSSMTSCCP